MTRGREVADLLDRVMQKSSLLERLALADALKDYEKQHKKDNVLSAGVGIGVGVGVGVAASSTLLGIGLGIASCVGSRVVLKRIQNTKTIETINNLNQKP